MTTARSWPAARPPITGSGRCSSSRPNRRPRLRSRSTRAGPRHRASPATTGSRSSSRSAARTASTSTTRQRSTSRPRSQLRAGRATPVPAFFGTDYTLRPGTGVGGSELYDPVPGTENGRLARPVLSGRDRHVAVHAPGPGQGRRTAGNGRHLAQDLRGHGVQRQGPDRTRPTRRSNSCATPMGRHTCRWAITSRWRRQLVQRWQRSLRPALPVDAGRGQNWTRVWMTDFYITAIEWNATHWSGQYDGVGQYGDVPAFRVEQILDLAEQYGLEVQLVLNDHGQFSSHVNPTLVRRTRTTPTTVARSGRRPGGVLQRPDREAACSSSASAIWSRATALSGHPRLGAVQRDAIHRFGEQRIPSRARRSRRPGRLARRDGGLLRSLDLYDD